MDEENKKHFHYHQYHCKNDIPKTIVLTTVLLFSVATAEAAHKVPSPNWGLSSTWNEKSQLMVADVGGEWVFVP